MAGANVDIIDTSTGEKRLYRDEQFDPNPDSGSAYGWTDGNFGCDCNRHLFFARAAGEPDPETECGDVRFWVPRAICDNGEIVELDGEIDAAPVSNRLPG